MQRRFEEVSSYLGFCILSQPFMTLRRLAVLCLFGELFG